MLFISKGIQVGKISRDVGCQAGSSQLDYFHKIDEESEIEFDLSFQDDPKDESFCWSSESEEDDDDSDDEYVYYFLIKQDIQKIYTYFICL